MLICAALRTDGCSYCGEEETAGRRRRERVLPARVNIDWIDRSKKNTSLARALMAMVTPDTALTSCLGSRATENELHLLLNIGHRHLFCQPPHLSGDILSFVVLLMSCHLHLISSFFVLPTTFTFSQILSHIVFI